MFILDFSKGFKFLRTVKAHSEIKGYAETRLRHNLNSKTHKSLNSMAEQAQEYSG